MMLPLCIIVTDFLPRFSAYSSAIFTSRFDPNGDIGLMPIAEPSRIFFPSSFWMNTRSFSASGVPARNSMPEYTSSTFSRKIMMLSFSGCFIGAPTPLK